MGDFDDSPALWYLYEAGYKAGRQVAVDMTHRAGHPGRKYPDPAAEALRRAVRWWAVALGPPEEKTIARGIDDGLNGRWRGY